jgi:hypothetical protein
LVQGIQLFDHLLYHFVLTHSNWEHVTMCFSESFARLERGLSERGAGLGRCALVPPYDCMSLAVHADGQAEEFISLCFLRFATGYNGRRASPHS